ncbi:hypothetical protein J4206_00720 [Candidatus Woesearchaeota archaeon]|nr:hypothetical protein [Candidatus Woesearchaeota archaeon]
MVFLFKLIGAVGLILIALGVITKQRKVQDKYYLLGGLFLTVYSIYIKDVVFIVLQIIFLVAAGYDLVKSDTFFGNNSRINTKSNSRKIKKSSNSKRK